MFTSTRAINNTVYKHKLSLAIKPEEEIKNES